MKSVFLGTRLEAFKQISLKTKVVKVITIKNSFIDKYVNKNIYNVIYVNKNNKMAIFNYIKICKCKTNFLLRISIQNTKKIFDLKKFFINSHPSLLPKYKGLRPGREALKNNERELGVTVHYMNENLDDGKIIIKKKFLLKKIRALKVFIKFFFQCLSLMPLNWLLTL